MHILTAPFVGLSRVAEFLDLWGLQRDIQSCLTVIDDTADIFLEPFMSALIVAEDRRNTLHPGVDPIAIARALLVRLFRGQIQGASTIEQQFVRVVSGRYERTMRRKVREQALAIAVARRRSKVRIATAYLSIATYGSSCKGIGGLRSRCGHDLAAADLYTVLAMVSRLKYPEPWNPSQSWRLKLRNRVEYVRERLPLSPGVRELPPKGERLRGLVSSKALGA